MAPVELPPSPSWAPATILGGHAFWAIWFSGIVFSSIYQSYIALPPSSATRHRQPARRGYVQVFVALAAVSFASALWFGQKFILLSYGVWATERGIELPSSYFGDKGGFRGGEHPGKMHIVQWLNDTTFYQDFLEIVAEKARYSWWGQQVNLTSISWSFYVAIEGRRRKIPHLWTFLALAQLVNLSYAQNLFFVGVLVTPVPLSDNVRDFIRGPAAANRSFFSRLVPAKPEGFLPNPALYLTLIVSSFVTIFLIPFASNTPSFVAITAISRVLPFAFLALPYIIPTSWGTIPTNPHAAHYSYTTLFRTVAAISTVLHLKSTALAIAFNTPESHYHRHSLLHPFREEQRSTFIRGYTAINRLIGAIREHPSVAAVGWDVILSGLSLGLWAGVRGLEVKEILGSSMILLKRTEKAIEGLAEEAKDKIVAKFEESAPSTRRRGRPAKSEVSNEEETNAVIATLPKKRGRPAKKQPLIDDDASDASYAPPSKDLVPEGDEDVDTEWESSAISWGTMSAFGLATASAGIFGAEVLAR